MTEVEEWRDIPGYEGYYQVSSLERVKRLERIISDSIGRNRRWGERVLRPQNSNGYLAIMARAAGRSEKLYIHRAIALAFIPNPDNKPQINHKNGIRSDNRIENLEWTTQKENVNHAFMIGLNNHKGEGNTRSKLTEKEVMEIRSSKGSEKSVSEKYNVSPALIGCIRRFKIWKHL